MAAPSTELLGRAQQELQQLLQRYTPALARETAPDKAPLRSGLDQLHNLSLRLERRTLRVAVFGLVSRGKSAVINALLGQPVLDTGPTHGVTRWPRSVYWQPDLGPESSSQPAWQVEFIDTPGLDEIDGQIRSEMAQTVADQADLILFVVAGTVTTPEHQALQQLHATQKPLLLVFNKMDLYPDIDRQAVAAQLHSGAGATAEPGTDDGRGDALADDLVWVAAAPAPVPVRTEWPDGRTTTDWEAPPPQIESLQRVLTTLLHRDAAALVTLNTLRQARRVESEVVGQVSRLYQDEADALIWRFAGYKGLAVALNPLAPLDLLGGMVADLVMIRSLARLYQFPITSYQASRLWGAILRSSGALLLSELASGLFGAGKTTAALALLGSPTGIGALTGAMVLQGGAAGYGTYAVGKAARVYLEQGCTWGPQGVSAVMNQVLSEAQTSDVLGRLRQTIRASLGNAAGNAISESP